MSVKILILAALIHLKLIQGVQQCGKTYTERRGLIQTPNFPGEFPVPIRCKWIIDGTDTIVVNSSIIVYFTQVYVLEGLTFEEYETYDSNYNIPGKRIHVVNETNISHVRFVRTSQNVLVISFEMDSLENTNLRVLDYLLDVYGFNMTYEISENEPRKGSCNMADCEYNGICYDNYKKFYCSCFPGYSGPSCSEGKNSLCSPQGKSRCHNAGVCKHIGANWARCICGKEFYGERCELRAQHMHQHCEECLISCPYPKEQTLDYLEYSISALPANAGNASVTSIRNQLQVQISNLLRKTDFRVHSVRVANVTQLKHGTEVTVFCYGSKDDKRKVEQLLSDFLNNPMRENATLRRYPFPPPKLIIQTIDAHPSDIIREWDGFHLSCVAKGSPSMQFTWIKDGQLINITNATNNKWTQTTHDHHLKDQYTSILWINKASYLDQGIFTCQVEDDDYRQCLSIKVTVKRAPRIRIEPMSLTVQRGEDFTLKCVQMSEPTFSSTNTKFTYSWTKNKELLPIKTGSEKYEILYPQGSILQVFKVDKPAIYSCLVQDGAVSSEVTIQVNVIDRKLINTCPGKRYNNVSWPETAPGSSSLQNCPQGFFGAVQRTCLVQDANHAQWQTPNFSLCTVDSLTDVDLNFEKLTLGYQTTDCLQILKAYENYLTKRTKLYPGEGARIVTIVLNVIIFNNLSKNVGDIQALSTVVYNICNLVLAFPASLINEQQIELLQRLVRFQMFLSEEIVEKEHFLHYSSDNLDVNLIKSGKHALILPSDIGRYPKWYSINMRLNINNNYKGESIAMAAVLYRNLKAFLPSRCALRLKDGTESEYEIISQIVASWPMKNGQDVSFSHDLNFSIDFKHDEINATSSNWNVNCAMAEFANCGFSWNINENECQTVILSKTTTRCICFQSGTFVVLITSRSQTVIAEEHKRYYVTSLVGCGCCLLFSAISLIVLAVYWSFQKSCLIFLKIQCCLSLTGTMAVFTLVLLNDFPRKYYSYILTTLETFILIAISSQISKFLLVLTELVQFSKTPNIKKTVIAITTGIPITTVFGSHLSHQSMSESINSWWLLAGSLSFYIFISCFIITFILFFLVYFIVMKKLNAYIAQDGGSVKLYTKRKRCLQRSTCIFICICLMIVASTTYVNFKTSLLSDYAFCISTVFLGSVLFFCYVIKPEHPLNREDCLQKLCVKRKAKYNSHVVNKSLNIFSKQSPECENQCGTEFRGQLEDPRPMMSFVHQDCCSDCTFGPNISKQCGRCRELENYKSSPKKYKVSTSDEDFMSYNQQSLAAPDVISTRVCVELDLVTPLLNNQATTSDSPMILCNIAVNPQGGNPNFQVPYISITEDTSAEENAKSPKGSPSTTTQMEIIAEEESKEGMPNDANPISDRLDGMLSKISHDLDYLLNRNADVQISSPSVGGTNLRKNSISSSSRMEQIDEEIENPEETTDLLRTTC